MSEQYYLSNLSNWVNWQNMSKQPKSVFKPKLIYISPVQIQTDWRLLKYLCGFGSVFLFNISYSGFLSFVFLLFTGLETGIILLGTKSSQRFAAVGRAAGWSWGVHPNRIKTENLWRGKKKTENLSEPPLLQQSSEMLVFSVKSQCAGPHATCIF